MKYFQPFCFFSVIAFLFMPFVAEAQGEKSANAILQEDFRTNRQSFEAAYAAFPDIPSGVLEAVSFTNTRFRHLTDADYGYADDSTTMPRAYGMMGLVANGKHCFRENLHLVSSLSGYDEKRILDDPETNVMAYAEACHKLSETLKIDKTKVESYSIVVQELSELPEGEEIDLFPMKSMLYSVYTFLGDAAHAEMCGFKPYNVDMQGLFGDDLERLSATTVTVSRDTDYPGAIWIPAPECNYSDRTDPVSAVVIHYTEGSYAGCISWFQNCDASVSAHYVIRSMDGQVTQMVRESDKAWHARSANAYTIGIEHEAYGDVASFFTDAMYASSADLIRDICSRRPEISPLRTFYRDTLDDGTMLNQGVHDLGGATACIQIRGHQHYPDQSHTDPGPYWDWNYYYKLINKGTEMEVMEGDHGDLDNINYGDDERRLYLIKGPEGSTISLTFQMFDLEKDYDFLWIYDGDDEFAPKLGRWNTLNPGTVTSTGNTMCVEFRSDCATSLHGWTADWKANVESVIVGVFPNPAKDYIQIIGEKNCLYDAVIFDVYGNQVSPNLRFMKSARVNVAKLSSGVYILHYGEALDMDRVVKFVKMK